MIARLMLNCMGNSGGADANLSIRRLESTVNIQQRCDQSNTPILGNRRLEPLCIYDSKEKTRIR